MEISESGPILINKTTNEINGPFEDAVRLLEEAMLCNKILITVIDKLQCVVLH